MGPEGKVKGIGGDDDAFTCLRNVEKKVVENGSLPTEID